MNESSGGFGVLSLPCEFTSGRRKVDVTPEAVSKRVDIEGTVRL